MVVDLVLPIGSLGPIAGEEDDPNLVSIARLPSHQTNAAYFHKFSPEPANWHFQVFTGSPDPDGGNSIRGEGISLPLIQRADLIVLIVSTDHSTVKLAKTVCDYLKAPGVGAGKIYALMNRAVGLECLSKAHAEEIIGLPIRTTMPYMSGNFSPAHTPPIQPPSSSKEPPMSWRVSLASWVLAPPLKESERYFSADLGYTLMRLPEGTRAMTHATPSLFSFSPSSVSTE